MTTSPERQRDFRPHDSAPNPCETAAVHPLSESVSIEPRGSFARDRINPTLCNTKPSPRATGAGPEKAMPSAGPGSTRSAPGRCGGCSCRRRCCGPRPSRQAPRLSISSMRPSCRAKTSTKTSWLKLWCMPPRRGRLPSARKQSGSRLSSATAQRVRKPAACSKPSAMPRAMITISRAVISASCSKTIRRASNRKRRARKKSPRFTARNSNAFRSTALRTETLRSKSRSRSSGQQASITGFAFKARRHCSAIRSTRACWSRGA
jgi:hypothetical protein